MMLMAVRKVTQPEIIPAELGLTFDRLENWGYWARDLGKRGLPIGSIESRYRPERGDLELRREPGRFIDSIDAQLVGKAIATTTGFPRRWSMLLKLRFYARADRWFICRKVAIANDNYVAELLRALTGLRNKLTRDGNMRYSPPVTVATSKE